MLIIYELAFVTLTMAGTLIHVALCTILLTTELVFSPFINEDTEGQKYSPELHDKVGELGFKLESN